MLTEDFWNRVSAETVLYFECDSMLCPNSEYKVEDFEHFDFIGGYWGNQLDMLDRTKSSRFNHCQTYYQIVFLRNQNVRKKYMLFARK